MAIRKQLSVFVENEPGVLARVSDALAANGVNIQAISVSDAVDDSVLRVVVDDDRKALDVLEEAQVLCVARDVLEVEVPDRRGALAEVAAALAARAINIAYAYGSSAGGGVARLYLRVKDPVAAEAALAGLFQGGGRGTRT